MNVLLFGPRTLAITAVLVIAHVVGAGAAGLASARSPGGSNTAAAEPDRPDPAAGLRLLGSVAGVCLLEAVAVAAMLAAATARGWRLVAGLAAAIFGVMTLQPQIEAVAFGVVAPSLAARIAIMGVVIAAIVSPVSVALFGRLGASSVTRDANTVRVSRTMRPWAVILIGGVVYVALYMVFGYFIAWQSPDVRDYYGSGEMTRGFLSHLWALQLRVPWFGPLQLFRGCLWAALGILILSLVTGPWPRTGVVLGLFFALMMNAQLLLPNGLMPDTVRLVHFAETVPSNFLLGLAVAWLMRHGT